MGGHMSALCRLPFRQERKPDDRTHWWLMYVSSCVPRSKSATHSQRYSVAGSSAAVSSVESGWEVSPPRTRSSSPSWRTNRSSRFVGVVSTPSAISNPLPLGDAAPKDRSNEDGERGSYSAELAMLINDNRLPPDPPPSEETVVCADTLVAAEPPPVLPLPPAPPVSESLLMTESAKLPCGPPSDPSNESADRTGPSEDAVEDRLRVVVVLVVVRLTGMGTPRGMGNWTADRDGGVLGSGASPDAGMSGEKPEAEAAALDLDERRNWNMLGREDDVAEGEGESADSDEGWKGETGDPPVKEETLATANGFVVVVAVPAEEEARERVLVFSPEAGAGKRDDVDEEGGVEVRCSLRLLPPVEMTLGVRESIVELAPPPPTAGAEAPEGVPNPLRDEGCDAMSSIPKGTGWRAT